MKTEVLGPDASGIEKVIQLLQKDEVVAVPTETVYGLAGNLFSPIAIQKIFDAKSRPTSDPLIVHVAHRSEDPQDSGNPDLSVLHGLVDASFLTSDTWEKMKPGLSTLWPGPLTIVVPRSNRIIDLVTAGRSTVAIRMPKHAIFQQILNRIAFPLVAPSANRFGHISPTQARHVLDELNGKIPAILDGGASVIGVESTIVMFHSDHLQILRPGKVGAAELTAAFPHFPIRETIAINPSLAPGMLEQHYSPTKKLFLAREFFSSRASALAPALKANWGILQFFPNPSPQLDSWIKQIKDQNGEITFRVTLSNKSPNDWTQVSQNLYSMMRALDADPQVQCILSDHPDAIGSSPTDPTHQGLIAAICDRLKRASARA